MYLLLLATNYQSNNSQTSITTNILINLTLAGEFLILETITHNEL